MAVLPVEVLVKIAFSIKDVEDLFAFLEALRPYDMLGPLAHLYELFTTRHHLGLWPSLALHPTILDSSERPLYEGITKYYEHVVVENVWSDVEWLKTYLSPMAQIGWNLKDIDMYLTSISLDEWTDLRITRLALDIEDEDEAIWCTNAVSQLPSLTCLEADISSFELEDFFANLAASQQITQLHLSFDEYQLTAFDLAHLTEWLRHQPVRHLGCEFGDWEDLDLDVKETFYQAMFNCPTMAILELSGCKVDDVDFAQYDFPMRSLVLHQCCLSSRQVEALVSRLERSKMTSLQLTDFTFDYMDGIVSLLEIQPRTRIQHLALGGLHKYVATWSILAPSIEKLTVERLIFCATEFPSDAAESLAMAIQNNPSICELHLNCCDITLSGLVLLIQSITHPSRQTKSKRVRWTAQQVQFPDPEIFQALVELAVDSGGEFVYEEV
ncbi:hypothetical protein Ae201684P_007325 [Aphanomyces euteiches]|uniref:F-box domain-containing protein n=1 Tax=Aphanomyces euteiches TaxID=100861 RepID=A0A6G0W8F5_9STRA|nr:hypothetical protein Ae201684_017673 [Aphanomyces euteiches]KAH9101140.1 hypothetical protein Ae201684P_007325 [Aphanomyces euteiches]KAH9151443.1 hypothetical protein AeRB84_005939 [Aphanomyces euteiches]